ncbi:MAG: AAA family ATPase [Clostridia bacterium]|nr:AAA family ATPase [Clostridia bacterium]
MNEFDRPQNKFLKEMYDDFLWLISSEPGILDEAQKKARQLEYNRKNTDTFNNIKSRKEYLDRANSRHADKRKEATSYFDEDEPIKSTKRKTVKTSSKQGVSAPKAKPTNSEKQKNEIQQPQLSKEQIVAQNALKLEEFYKKVDDAHLVNHSKLVLKKMIDYARKYSEGIVKNYIPFNMRLYTDNDETLYNIVNLIIDSFTYFGYMKNDSAVERSFYVVEDSNHITDLYNNAHSLVIFKDVAGLLNKDKATQDKLLNIWKTVIYDYSNLEGITTIICDKNKEKVNELLENNLILKDKIFDFELISTSANTQEIYHKILHTLKKDYTVSGEFDVKLLDYITETFPKSQLTAPDYAQSLIEQILFNQTTNSSVIDANSIPAYEKNKSIDEIFEDLNNLVGLDNIKDMLQDLVSLMKFKSKTEGSLKIKDTNMHMVFLGNPGTGKTTVARMIAGILYNLNYIDQNKCIEVSAKDLIGQYVGQTAPKTISVIEKALGGVLFIDEAYSLASKPGSSGNSFNEECIATLIQAMENYRDNLVLIFAGYNKEMDAFLKSNSGIVSRIGYTMQFNDYTLDELIEILKSMFKKAGFFIDEDAIQVATEIIEEYRTSESFGNARFIRNLYEKAIIKHAANTANTTSKKALKTITAQDFSTENLLKF